MKTIIKTISSKEQLKKEFDQMYKELTNPETIKKRKFEKENKERLKKQVNDYVL